MNRRRRWIRTCLACLTLGALTACLASGPGASASPAAGAHTWHSYYNSPACPTGNEVWCKPPQQAGARCATVGDACTVVCGQVLICQ